jgi:hypothetical protein
LENINREIADFIDLKTHYWKMDNKTADESKPALEIC